MKLTKCPNGHFYDEEKYQQCPHCTGNVSGQNGAERPTDAFMGSAGMQQMGGSMAGGYQGGPAASAMDVTQRGPSIGGNYSGNDSYATVGFAETNGNRQQWENSKASAGENLSSDDEGKTVAYMAWNRETSSADENKTVGGSKENSLQAHQAQPIVGWLVCVEGNNYGKAFDLYCGKNFIGRSSEMDVSLDDKTVSRVKHAIIVYEPKERRYFAQPGDSHELFYRNETVVLSSTELNDRDTLTIGKTKLVFVPFCDQRFGWESE
ncbi:MAG: FHA domain-containing protein [Lachnospiraceae bacterium]|nr:FHA domain-containing protein [Lachnospiraceae bacterium]